MSSTPHHVPEADRRVVITGIGVVSSLGRTPEQFWQSLTQPQTSPSVATETNTEGTNQPVGVADFDGQIGDFGDLPDAIRKKLRKSLKVMNRETQMGVAAGQQALLRSRLIESHDPDRVGLCFGADNVSVMPEDFRAAVEACSDADGGFDMDRWGTEGLSEIAPLWLLKCLPNMPACHLAIVNDLRGPGNTITQRDVAFGMAVAEACRKIKSRDADAMLVGATGTTLSPFNLMHARLENEVAAEGEPSDNESSGDDLRTPFPGEGAGAIVLEDLQVARDRGAHIYGELLSSASATCINRDGRAECAQALESAMRQSLRQSKLSPASIGHIHASGLGHAAEIGNSAEGEDESIHQAEWKAIAEVLGPAHLETPVVVTKGRLGHAGAGAAALELIASLLALEQGHLFSSGQSCSPGPDGDSSGQDGEHLSECSLRFAKDNAEPAGDSFLSLSLFGRGLGNCIAVGAYRE